MCSSDAAHLSLVRASHGDLTHLSVCTTDSAKEFIQEQVAYAWSTVYDFGTAVVDWVREKTSGALRAVSSVRVFVAAAETETADTSWGLRV